VPGCTIEFAGDANLDTRNYRVNASKITSTLPQFTPVWSVRQGAEQLYETFKEVGITLDEFDGWKYRRIGQIKQLMRADGWVPICVGRDDGRSGRIVQRRAPSLVGSVQRRCCAGPVLAALTVVAGRRAAGTCQARPA
jgi:hypothetical protein